MKRHLLLTLSLLAASALGFSSPALLAAEKTVAAENKAEKSEVEEKTGKPYPYIGKVTKVDAAGNTFSLNGGKGDRVFTVGEKTKITKDGKPATLADLAEGNDVRGSVSKQGDKRMTMSLMIGAKEKPAPAASTTESPTPATPPTVEPTKPSTPDTKPTATEAKPAATPAKGTGKATLKK